MIDQDKVISIVKTGWFNGTSNQQIEKILKYSKIREYRADDFVYMAGAHSQSLYCILDGKVSLSIIDPKGDEFGLAIWTVGHWFGETAIGRESKMPLQSRVMHGATLLEVPIKAIDEVLDDSAEFYRNIMLDMIERTRLLFSLVELLMFRPLRARVAMRVLSLVEMFGEPDGDTLVLPIKFSQSDFAMMSGGSRQRINQIFRQWASQGIFQKKNKRYVVLDLSALKREVEATED